MVFNATFNNILAISWRSVLLVEKATDLPQFTDKLYHIMFYFCCHGYDISPLEKFSYLKALAFSIDSEEI
jgi:hypothetical protein